MLPSARWFCPILLTSTRSPPGCFGGINKSSAPPFCWLYQYGMHHSGGVTAMVRSPEIFEPVTLFRWPEGGTPSKNFAPRNILGLSNPHCARRRGAVPFRKWKKFLVKMVESGKKVPKIGLFSPSKQPKIGEKSSQNSQKLPKNPVKNLSKRWSRPGRAYPKR